MKTKTTHRKLARRLQELMSEIGRLNRARIGSDQFARLSPRDRTRAVKAALAAHHQKASRCC
jgi:hypothetical protein